MKYIAVFTTYYFRFTNMFTNLHSNTHIAMFTTNDKAVVSPVEHHHRGNLDVSMSFKQLEKIQIDPCFPIWSVYLSTININNAAADNYQSFNITYLRKQQIGQQKVNNNTNTTICARLPISLLFSQPFTALASRPLLDSGGPRSQLRETRI